MFQSKSSRFLAILESLTDSSCRPLEKKVPHPVTELDDDTVTDVYQEIFAAGVDLANESITRLSEGEEEICERSLMQLATEGTLVYLSIDLSIHLSICSAIHHSFYPSIYLHCICLSIHPSIHPAIHLSIYPFIYPSILYHSSIHLSIHSSIYLSIHLFIYPSIYPFIYLSIQISIHN